MKFLDMCILYCENSGKYFADNAFKNNKKKTVTKTYDKENKKPVIKASICNGEQVAGFKDIHTGKIEEVMLIKNQADLDAFKKMYGIDDDIEKEY